jgi:hypothetical protein
MKKSIIVLVDDLDGTEGDDVREVTLSLNGTAYELDLSAANREALDAALAPFVSAGRRVVRKRRKRSE